MQGKQLWSDARISLVIGDCYSGVTDSEGGYWEELDRENVEDIVKTMRDDYEKRIAELEASHLDFVSRVMADLEKLGGRNKELHAENERLSTINTRLAAIISSGETADKITLREPQELNQREE